MAGSQTNLARATALSEPGEVPDSTAGDAPDPVDERPRGRPARPRRRRWWLRVLLTFVLLVVGAAVCARALLPSYLRSYVNQVLDQSPDYGGRVGDIEIHLWRGAYAIRDISIVKKTRSIPIPFFRSPRVAFSLDWRSLRKGSLRGNIDMERPQLNFVHAPSPEDSQDGSDQPWLSILNDLFPFRIDKASVREGEIHFRTFHTTPRIDVYLSSLNATLLNLTNVDQSVDPLVATLRATGTVMDSGQFELQMGLEPQAHRPTFTLAARMLNVDVRDLNPLSLAYGDFDFEAGRFDFVLDVTAKNGTVQGYAKPLFRNIEVLSLRDLQNKNPLQLFWEALVGVVGAVFQNQSRDQFGTSITLEGDLDAPRTRLLEIIGNVLRNAFIRAYLPRLERRLSPDLFPPGTSSSPLPDGDTR